MCLSVSLLCVCVCVLWIKNVYIHRKWLTCFTCCLLMCVHMCSVYVKTERDCVCVCVCVRDKEREIKQRKLLIILASIRRNTLSWYPWRRVTNASYCSLADIRSSSPPPSSIPLSLSHVPFLSSLPHVHCDCDMHVTHSSSYLPSFFFHFFSPSSTACPLSKPFHSSFPISAMLPMSPIFPSPVLSSSFILFTSQFSHMIAVL